MRLIILFLILIIASSCRTSKENRQIKEIYLGEFKMTYFKSLLKKGFNNSKSYNEAIEIDNSHYGEPILSLDDLHCIDSLTTIGNRFMVIDSIERIGRTAEGTEGKVIFYYAIEKYNSKWLDSISKQHLKKYWKSEINFRKSLRE